MPNHAALQTPPVLGFLALMIAAGGLYLLLLGLVPRIAGAQRLLLLALGLGLAMRLVHLAGPPIFEDDYHRYLWDGAVVAAGLSPYAVAPAKVRQAADPPDWLSAYGDAAVPTLPPGYERLAQEGAATLSRINYPGLTTIYPPLTQAAFALAHRLAPFSLSAWRAVLLAADLISLALLLMLLARLGRPAAWSLLYWWNPLLIKEGFNSAHMDLLLPPFLIGALLLLNGRRPWAAGAALAGAAAVKLWPLMLIPALAAGRRPWPRALGPVAGASALALLLLSPQLAAFGGSGLEAFASLWQRNSLLFPLLKSLLAQPLGSDSAGAVLRAILALGVGLLALRAARLAIPDADRVAAAWLWPLGLLLLAGPAFYPWYLIWLLPLLCLRPQPALLLLTATLPLYYARFPLSVAGLDAWFAAGVLPVIFGPVYAGLVFAAGGLSFRRARASCRA